MKKEIVAHKVSAESSLQNDEWVDLESIASVQLTSEDPAFPIENALSANPERNEIGWRAATPGPQTITLTFDNPQSIRRMQLFFIDHLTERSQEIVLRYSSLQETGREIVRQQWNFSPTGSSQEAENYTVNLESVTKLELEIDPDRGAGVALATLNFWRLA